MHPYNDPYTNRAILSGLGKDNHQVAPAASSTAPHDVMPCAIGALSTEAGTRYADPGGVWLGAWSARALRRHAHDPHPAPRRTPVLPYSQARAAGRGPALLAYQECLRRDRDWRSGARCGASGAVSATPRTNTAHRTHSRVNCVPEHISSYRRS